MCARSRSRRSASRSRPVTCCISLPAATRMAAMEPTARRQAPSLGQVLARLIGEARQLVADYAELTVLDARRAAIRLAWILRCVLVAAVRIVTSWMGLVAAAVVFAWGHGAAWPIALAVAAVLKIVAAPALAWVTPPLAEELAFPA